jgi:selenide,water dikinase
LCDPQTSGGLLICVREQASHDFENFARNQGHELSPIGQLREKSDYWIKILEAK